jgi:uncharacterized membrane protein YkgB
MNSPIKKLANLRLFRSDLDYHLVRASMVIIYLLFGYQKWWEYKAQTLVPFIRNGPPISCMYPVFDIRGATWFLGISEWITAGLPFWGYWNKKAGALGIFISTATFITTIKIIPSMPNGWDTAAGFPAMKGNVAFLMKDVILFAVSFYLLKQDLLRVSLSGDAISQYASESNAPSGEVSTLGLTKSRPT